ncbi:MAG: GNAT family N-acetyltransferase [Thermodesulfobacteriota bacterium]
MEITFKPSSVNNLEKYIALYKSCFPEASHLQFDYLSWLYYANPMGEAIGADAWCDDNIVGQVMAVPGKYFFRDEIVKGLLAVNVVVHPSCQGRHLFKKLGLRMCEYGAHAGYDFVIGVANRAATLLWVRQMGFQLVIPLEARVGVGTLSLKKRASEIINSTELRHLWDENSILWRLNNPSKDIFLGRDTKTGWATAYAPTGKFGITATAEFPLDAGDIDNLQPRIFQPFLPRLFLGLVPTYSFGNCYVKIPERMKQSPLNLIFKNLIDSKDRVDPFSCFINFLDFDAF